MKKILLIVFILLIAAPVHATVLFTESFDNNNFGDRGWFDGAVSSGTTTSEHIPGSTASLQCHFIQGQNGCQGIGVFPLRKNFSTSVDSIYVSYWIKHSSNWIGSNTTYHPHIFMVLSNLDLTGPYGDYPNIAWDYLNTYIEENQGKLVVSFQDGVNVDKNNINTIPSLYTQGVETRAIAGCNGTQTDIGQDSVSCYPVSTNYWNGMMWKAATDHFITPPTKTDWHFVEAYIQMNTISNGVGQPDGIVQSWYDGSLEIDHQNVIIRTGQHPTMKFGQFVFSPYISVSSGGSPATQDIWFDELTVATSRPSAAPLKPPYNLRIQ